MKYLSPSILAADFDNLKEQITMVEQAGVRYLHFDVMDGCFVPNISFGLPILHNVRQYTQMNLDVHLMIEQPMRYIDQVAGCGADIITVHQEACEDLRAFVKEAHALGKKAGVAVRPQTPIDVLEPVLAELDLALVMTVNPGFGGQHLIQDTLDKVRALRRHVTESGLHTVIEVDGGINLRTIQAASEAGADLFVAGSAVFKGDIEENVKKLDAAIHTN